MPNHCMNNIKMVFKEEHCAKQLKTDLKNLGKHNNNLCQLVFAYDYDSKKMTFLDGSTKTLEAGLGCPAGKYWGTKWGTYNLVLDVNDSLILEYCFDTAWAPMDAEVLLGLIKKYDLLTIVNNYWEPGCGFAGTLSNDPIDGSIQLNDQIYDTGDDYQPIFPENTSYDSFKKTVQHHHHGRVSAAQLKSLFKKFNKYECMYLSFEQRAYNALADTENEPMFNTFITNNLA